MIPGRDTQSTRFISLKAPMLSVSILLLVDNSRTSQVYIVCIRKRERMWNVRLHVWEDHLCNALSTPRGIPVTKIRIMPQEILKALPQIPAIGRTVMPQQHLLEGSKGLTGGIGQDTGLRLWSGQPIWENSTTAEAEDWGVRNKSRKLRWSPRR